MLFTIEYVHKHTHIHTTISDIYIYSACQCILQEQEIYITLYVSYFHVNGSTILGQEG